MAIRRKGSRASIVVSPILTVEMEAFDLSNTMIHVVSRMGLF